MVNKTELNKFYPTTVSVGICAHNEEETIGPLLKSVLKQTQENFLLKEVFVVSDGSTDKTVMIAKTFNNPIIAIIDDRKRLGKAVRMNTIFTKASGDLLILLDADIQLGNEDIFGLLVKGFENNLKAGLIGGRIRPKEGRTLIEKSVNASVEIYQRFAAWFKEGHNVYNCNGPILALSKSLYRQIIIPYGVVADDTYLYFFALSLGFEFQFIPPAFIWYRSPSSFLDQIHQNRRYLFSKKQLRNLFGDLFDREYLIPTYRYYLSFFIQFLKSPLYTFFIFILNLYARFLIQDSKITDKWETIKSTKGGLFNE